MVLLGVGYGCAEIPRPLLGVFKNMPECIGICQSLDTVVPKYLGSCSATFRNVPGAFKDMPECLGPCVIIGTWLCQERSKFSS